MEPADDFVQYVGELVRTFKVPGLSIAVVRTAVGDSPTFQFYNSGKALESDLPQLPSQPTDEHTLYCIASTSKAFTTTALGLLIEDYKDGRGKVPLPAGVHLNWDTKVASLLPGEFVLQDAYASTHVSLADLCSHLSGVPGNDLAYGPDSSTKEIVKGLRYLRPGAELREKFQYNNLMYMTIAHIIATYSGQTFTSFVSSRIFQPLGMQYSTYQPRQPHQEPLTALRQLAHCWVNNAGLDGTDTRRVPMFNETWKEESLEMNAGPGGVISCTSDMAKWVQTMLTNGKSPDTQVIPISVMEHITTGRSVQTGRPSHPELSAAVYGAGWVRSSYQGRQMLQHTGDAIGWSSLVTFFPDDGLGVVCLSNAGSVYPALGCVTYRVAEDVLGLKRVDWLERFSPVKDTEQVDHKRTEKQEKQPSENAQPQDLAQYSGTYWNDAYGALTLCTWPAEESSISAQVFADYRLVDPDMQTHPEKYIVGRWKKVWCSHLRMIAAPPSAREDDESGQEREEHEFQLYVDTIYPQGCGVDHTPFVVRVNKDWPAKVVFAVDDAVEKGLGMWISESQIKREGSIRERAEVWFDKVA
ncbi:beta-lactamase/transpeptidase-like protein [Calocera viscosa TUFC12733]|uniref:Beta-lactamase/transpeptidase-like protein n=1 Tax=Calocera viscosa (strain TUFC12733) TaxID=1330018 RepID=A0A167SDJ4_CALVF|nr:beta-lactamase/transpeptidase-like protein [Calocera viscosa TUFC12733]